MIRNKFHFLDTLMKLYLIIILISFINTQETLKKESTPNPEKNSEKNEEEIKTKINFINCDKFCSKFEPTCPEIYNEVIKLSTEYILENNLILSKNKNIPFEIVFSEAKKQIIVCLFYMRVI